MPNIDEKCQPLRWILQQAKRVITFSTSAKGVVQREKFLQREQ